MNDPRRPALLVAVCTLVLVEVAALAGLGAVFGLQLVRGDASTPGATVFLALFCWGVAAVLALCARGLWRGRRWARSPVMTWQIMLVVLALGWFGVEAELVVRRRRGGGRPGRDGTGPAPVVAVTVPEDSRRTAP
ncbi:hypothetical protein [Cellulomonas soli]